MADELSGLAGIDVQDEAAVRVGVASNIAAATSPEVVAEQNRLKTVWRKLQEVEAELEKIAMTENAEGNEGLAFREQQLSAAATRYGREIKQIQDNVERLKVVAKQRAQEREQQEARMAQQAAEAARAADAINTTINRRDQLQTGAQLVRNRNSNMRSARIDVNPAHIRGTTASGAAAAVPATAAVEDYRGGDILPSEANITAKVIRSQKGLRTRRDLDDGNEAMFQARQRKAQKEKRIERIRRERSEKKAALKEERAAASAERREADRQAGIHETDSSDLSSSESEEESINDSDLESEDEEEEELVQLGPDAFIDVAVWEALLGYQQTGVQWLVKLADERTGGILGDEMGLGKTVQVAAFLNVLASSNRLQGPVLIVAPLTVLWQWVQEMHKWCPKLRTQIFHSSGSASGSRKEQIRKVANQPAVVLTTYAAVAQQNDILQDAGFQFLILDEGHKISNPEASTTIACKSFATPHRIVLTGSPIQNTLKELWCLFDFVVPGLLGNQERFISEFETPIAISRNSRATTLELSTAVECAKALRAHIGPFMLRRLKKDVNAMLPAKHERVVRCALTDEQLEKYCEVLLSPQVQEFVSRTASLRSSGGRLDRNYRAADGGLVSGMSRSGVSQGMQYQAFKVLSQLRMLCNHLDIFTLKQDDVKEGGTGTDINFRSNHTVKLEHSGKLQALAKLLARWKENGHKALVFSQTRMMLDIIENYAEQQNYKYIRMDGNTPTKHRGVLIDRFNDDDSIFVALLTTKVGGLGVNLTGADRVVIFDPDWNPVTDEQARERAWRIGQRREVCVYRMITAGTVEEHILHRQLAKTYVTDKVLKDPTLQRFFTINSLSDAFFLGPQYEERVTNDSARAMVLAPSDLTVQEEVDEEMLREDEEDNMGARITSMNGTDGGAAGGAADSNAQTSMLSNLVDGETDGMARATSGLMRRMATDTAQQMIARVTSSVKEEPKDVKPARKR